MESCAGRRVTCSLGPARAPLVLDRVPDLLHCFAHFTARLADVLLDGSGNTLSGPFGLEIRILCGLAYLFLDVALRLFDLPLQLILVHGAPPQGVAAATVMPATLDCVPASQ